jgi:hypothetical protein
MFKKSLKNQSFLAGLEGIVLTQIRLYTGYAQYFQLNQHFFISFKQLIKKKVVTLCQVS